MIQLTKIQEGMKVYDAEGNNIGKVDYVQFADEDPNQAGPETATPTAKPHAMNILKTFGEALNGESDVPEPINAKLMRHGYLRVDTSNIFESDYYVALNHVKAVAGSDVHINATKDDLMKL